MNDKQFAVLGLGVFGSTVATTLAEYGCEVLAVDRDITCVERISNEVTKAVVGDVTDKNELEELGIGEFDVVFITIANHFEDSVLATMLVKELGVPCIITKAKNKIHKQILEQLGSDRVIRVEKESGERIAKSMLRKNIVDLVELDNQYSIVEIKVSDNWVGKTLNLLNLRNTYHMNVLGIRKNGDGELSMEVKPDYIVQSKDHFLVLSPTEEIDKFDYLMKG
ncbi:MAG: TrkA family potassium uptake protein [Thomasclavelia sp.]|jgi:trk system potassium uptake protein TrkA|nr:TrkA family potassium uptake protein [Thomasclavelia sp.]